MEMGEPEGVSSRKASNLSMNKTNQPTIEYSIFSRQHIQSLFFCDVFWNGQGNGEISQSLRSFEMT
jgi:hypothetical protein